MAEYHLNAKFFTRSKGHSAVAAAAYRAGEKLHDDRTDTTHDYSRKKGIEATEILIPETAPDWMRERSQLWNKIEQTERRKDSQLCQEFDIALPVELSREQQKAALCYFAHEQFVSRGYVVDIAYHAMDTHNPHAHLMVPLRPVEGDGFGKKLNRWGSYNNELHGWREAWARHANHALEQAGHSARIDHRSLKERGIDRTPQIHIGKDAWHGHKKGEEFDRWAESKTIANTNNIRAEIRQLEQQVAEEEARQHLTREERTTAAALVGTTTKRDQAKNNHRRDPSKSRQNTVEDRSATTLAGTYTISPKSRNSDEFKPVSEEIEDQRKLIEQFQTIKDAGRERHRRDSSGEHPASQTAEAKTSAAGRPPQHSMPMFHVSYLRWKIAYGYRPPQPIAKLDPHMLTVQVPEVRDERLGWVDPVYVASLREAARQSPNSQKQAQKAEQALHNAAREPRHRERPHHEYLKELARQMRANGADALHDPRTDIDIAARMRIAGFSWNQINRTIVSESAIATSLPSAEHQTLYLESLIRPALLAMPVRQRHEEMWRWRQKQSPEVQGEYRLDRLGLATESSERTAVRQRSRNIEPQH